MGVQDGIKVSLNGVPCRAWIRAIGLYFDFRMCSRVAIRELVGVRMAIDFEVVLVDVIIIGIASVFPFNRCIKA
jgi:hypothetical protein